MSLWRRATAWLVVVVAAALWARPVVAQSITLVVSNLKVDSMAPAPNMTVSAIQARPELGPFAVTLELSTEAAFSRPFYIGATDGTFATFTIDSLLPEKTRIFMRARLFARTGQVLAETQQQHPVQAWVQLIEPAPGNPTIVRTRTPRFVWRSPPISLPPGPWQYDLTVFNTLTGRSDAEAFRHSDTSFVFQGPLQTNTSYRWQLVARASNSRGVGEVTVRSTGTFVITDPGAPTATIFYQNFPNPFGRDERLPTTCFWFDLATPATVRLTIYNLRLQRVKQMVPGPIGDGRLTAGAYGRGDQLTQTGCDSRLSWDGRDDKGLLVPSGVYVAEFIADGVRTTRKLYFRKP